MKKTGVVFLILAALVLVSGVSVFAQTSESIGITATLDKGVSLPATNTILKCPGTLLNTDDPWTKCNSGTVYTTINFDTLKHKIMVKGKEEEAGCFYGENFFMVFLYPSAWGGAGYTLQQQFTWADPTFQQESLVFTPVYVPEDMLKPLSQGGVQQGGLPSGASVGVKGAATGTAYKKIYDSGSSGLNRIVRAIYGIPPIPESGIKNDIYNGWQPVPLTQKAGPYTGTLSITITQK